MEKDLMEKPEDFNETGEGTKVLCGASAYEKKFYLNEEQLGSRGCGAKTLRTPEEEVSRAPEAGSQTSG